jgi:hypothetical protein
VTTLTHAVVGQRERAGSDESQDLFQHDRARHQDLGAGRVDPRQPLAFGARHALEASRECRERGQREHVPVHLRQRPTVFLQMGQLRECVDRTRGTVELFGLRPLPALPCRAKRAPDVSAQTLEGLVRGRVLVEHRLGETECAERHSDDAQQIGPTHQHELRTASSDVHHERRVVVEPERGLHREVDEASLLLARDDARCDAGLALRPGEELAPVASLANGGGRGAQDAVHRVATRQLHVTPQGIHGAAHRDPAQSAVVERAATHLHHLALAVEHGEAVPTGRFRDHHVDGVGADVDGGDAHGTSETGLAMYRPVRASGQSREEPATCGEDSRGDTPAGILFRQHRKHHRNMLETR